MFRDETPEEVAARWNGNHNGNTHKYGATILSKQAIDRKTAESIAAERHLATLLGGECYHGDDLSRRHDGDVVCRYEVQVVNPRWGVWWKDYFSKHPNRRIVAYLNGQPVGWTTCDQIRRQKYWRKDAPIPNFCMPISDLNPM